MFITFEGIDGCGKSTQAALLCEALGGGALATREPGGWEGGGALRGMALDGSLRHPWSEAFLFLLDRAEHVARVISPALASGRHVVCERYHDSTLAYQVWGRGMPLEPLREAAALAAFPVPDVTLLFHIEPELALARVAGRGRPDSFEKEGLPFMRRIDEGYRALAAAEPQRWIVIECGTRTPAELFEVVKEKLSARGLSL
ncbi:MAG: dTMP kinase [Synergistaceae bacterium]|nr:dTMP kinase [Synergistaceae bacterium]